MTPRRAALGVLALVVAGLTAAVLALYLQREAIGVRFALDFLRAHGVPADIKLDRLDLNGASGSMRLGPWWRPDLTVQRMEMTFKPFTASRKGVGPPQVRSLTLFQPTLRGRWKDGRLDFGSLQVLIDQAAHAKPSGAPPPDVDVQGGKLLLDTPGGRLVITLDATAQGGRLRSIHARLAPVDVSAADLRLADVQGVLSGQPDGPDHLHLNAAFGASQGHGHTGAASGLTLTLEAVTPNGAAAATAGASGPLRPLDATLRLHAGRLALKPAKGGPLNVQGADVTLDLDGSLDGSNRFAGRLHATGRAQAVGEAAGMLHALTLELASPAISAGAAGGRFAATGPFTLDLAATGGRVETPAGAAALGPSHLTAGGYLDAERALRIKASGALTASAALDHGDAVRLGRKVLGAVDPVAADAFAAALERMRLETPAYELTADADGAALRLPQGATLSLANGAIRLRPVDHTALVKTASGGEEGGFDLAGDVPGLPQLALSVPRYRRARNGASTAQIKLALNGGLGPLQDVRLAAAATVEGRGGAWRLAASDCAELAAGAVRSGSKVVASAVKARLCPVSGAPLAAYAEGAWRLNVRAQDGAFTLPAAGFKGALTAADIVLQGGRGPMNGQVGLQRLALQDITSAPRVRPLLVDGTVDLGGGQAEGRLRLTLAASGAAVGDLAAHMRLDTGEGQGRFDSVPLHFDPKGLQAGDIVPAAAHALPQAEGVVQLSARAAWGRQGLGATSAEIRTGGLSFKSPAGRLDALRGDVRFSSLLPLATAGVQTLSAEKLETLLPLTDIRTDFALSPGWLDLKDASASVVQGRIALDPMTIGLMAPQTPTSGVLRMKGVSLQGLIGAFNLSNAVSIQAKVDGELPFTLQPAASGAWALRLGPGRVYAEGPGRLTIQRQALGGAVATAGAAGAQPNAVQDFAYQALENLAFTRLEASIASRPAGRLGVVFHIVGRHDPKIDAPTRIGLLQLIRGRAFDKPLPLPKGTPVDLTLDTSLNLDDLLAAYGALNASPGSAKVQP